MVELVDGSTRLGKYIKVHIWELLGIKDMTFHLEKREDLRGRMPDMSIRDPKGSGKAVHNKSKM